MKFASVDDAVRAYARARERGGIASRSVVAHGREYESRCETPRCRRARTAARDAARAAGNPLPTGWVERYSKDAGAMVQRCAYCGRPRRWVDSYVMGGHVGAGRVGRPPSAMVRAGDLAPIGALLQEMAEPLELGPGRSAVFVRYVVSGHSADAVAIDASRLAVAGRLWSGDDVRRAVRQARSWMERRLRGTGLLQPRVRRFRSMGGETCRTSGFSR